MLVPLQSLSAVKWHVLVLDYSVLSTPALLHTYINQQIHRQSPLISCCQPSQQIPRWKSVCDAWANFFIQRGFILQLPMKSLFWLYFLGKKKLMWWKCWTWHRQNCKVTNTTTLFSLFVTKIGGEGYLCNKNCVQNHTKKIWFRKAGLDIKETDASFLIKNKQGKAALSFKPTK